MVHARYQFSRFCVVPQLPAVAVAGCCRLLVCTESSARDGLRPQDSCINQVHVRWELLCGPRECLYTTQGGWTSSMSCVVVGVHLYMGMLFFCCAVVQACCIGGRRALYRPTRRAGLPAPPPCRSCCRRSSAPQLWVAHHGAQVPGSHGGHKLTRWTVPPPDLHLRRGRVWCWGGVVCVVWAQAACILKLLWRLRAQCSLPVVLLQLRCCVVSAAHAEHGGHCSGCSVSAILWAGGAAMPGWQLQP